MKYPIVEVFTSIQGEGLYTGAPANFIRLAGCNLSCAFCDTDKEAKEELAPKEILERLDPAVQIVVITGGEPTTHDLGELTKALNGRHRIHLETNGTNDIVLSTQFKYDWISVSPKRDAEVLLSYADEAKWLIPEWDYEDIDWDISERHYLQPVNFEKTLNMRNVDLCKYLLTEHPRSDLRLSIQLHKVISVR